MENNEFKEVSIKNGTCSFLMTKLKDFECDNILIDE